MHCTFDCSKTWLIRKWHPISISWRCLLISNILSSADNNIILLINTRKEMSVLQWKYRWFWKAFIKILSYNAYCYFYKVLFYDNCQQKLFLIRTDSTMLSNTFFFCFFFFFTMRVKPRVRKFKPHFFLLCQGVKMQFFISCATSPYRTIATGHIWYFQRSFSFRQWRHFKNKNMPYYPPIFCCAFNSTS